MATLYPLKFKSIFKETPWGGNRLGKTFGKDIPSGVKIGESWEVVDREEANSLILNGPYQGETLRKLMVERPGELLGASRSRHARFPLLVKFIDVTGRLSLQVHPNDVYAKARENDEGKVEAWYVVQAEPGSWVVCGLKAGVSLEFFEKCLEGGGKDKIESCLNFLTVKSGDIIFIPPGIPHTAGDGLTLLEVQQNSDITYRMYDWNSNRPIHLKKAMEVMKFISAQEKERRDRPSGLSVTDKVKVLSLLECDKFIMQSLETDEAYTRKISGFHILTFINGNCDIYYGKGEGLKANAGDNVLIPAILESYKIQPKSVCKILTTYLPELG